MGGVDLHGDINNRTPHSGTQVISQLQLTCFTCHISGTKVQILTRLLRFLCRTAHSGTQFSCFTGIKVRILTLLSACGKGVTHFLTFVDCNKYADVC